MPWTSKTFKEKHAKSLTPAQAAHAARIANRLIKTLPEGQAIATAIKLAKATKKGEK